MKNYQAVVNNSGHSCKLLGDHTFLQKIQPWTWCCRRPSSPPPSPAMLTSTLTLYLHCTFKGMHFQGLSLFWGFYVSRMIVKCPSIEYFIQKQLNVLQAKKFGWKKERNYKVTGSLFPLFITKYDRMSFIWIKDYEIIQWSGLPKLSLNQEWTDTFVQYCKQ